MGPAVTERKKMLSGVKSLVMGGREVWPLVEGGKGVSATNHASSGAWALAGGVGTVSAVNALQPVNAMVPMLVTLAGIARLVKSLQP